MRSIRVDAVKFDEINLLYDWSFMIHIAIYYAIENKHWILFCSLVFNCLFIKGVI